MPILVPVQLSFHRDGVIRYSHRVSRILVPWDLGHTVVRHGVSSVAGPTSLRGAESTIRREGGEKMQEKMAVEPIHGSSVWTLCDSAGLCRKQISVVRVSIRQRQWILDHFVSQDPASIQKVQKGTNKGNTFLVLLISGGFMDAGFHFQRPMFVYIRESTDLTLCNGKPLFSFSLVSTFSRTCPSFVYFTYDRFLESHFILIACRQERRTRSKCGRS